MSASSGSVRTVPSTRWRPPGRRQPDDRRGDAIRFQASAQGVADRSFGLNHPKDYLAYPLAPYHPDGTDEVLAERVVRATSDARRGAAFLDLTDERPDRVDLTPLGRELVRFALDRHGSVDAALREFEDWRGSRKRFCELAPEWGLLARRIVWVSPATKLLVEEPGTMHDDGVVEPTLVDLVEWLHVPHPTFTVELFVRGTGDTRSRVLDGDGELRAAEPHRLDPETDSWRLRRPVRTRGGFGGPVRSRVRWSLPRPDRRIGDSSSVTP